MIYTGQYCVLCGREKRPTEIACPCGSDCWSLEVAGTADPDLLEPPPQQSLSGLLAGLDLPPGYLLLLSGEPGSGKSTISMRAFRTPPVYVSSEMHPPLVLAYAKRQNTRLFSVRRPVVDLEAGLVDLGAVEANTPLILDSLSACGDPVLALRAAQEWTKKADSPAIVIAHTTKDGLVRGSRSLEHDADVVVMLKARDNGYLLTVTKNRLGRLFSRPYRLTEKGAELPSFDRYYSIEGHGPEYEIKPFPPGGRYAGPYQLKRKLPPPPLAVAAEVAPPELYPGGLVEPGDIEDRAKFAKAAGLPFWRIKDGFPN